MMVTTLGWSPGGGDGVGGLSGHDASGRGGDGGLGEQEGADLSAGGADESEHGQFAASATRLLETVILIFECGEELVFHAMPVRRRYWHLPP